MLAPIRRIEFVQPHGAAFVRGVDEATLADVDADMTYVRAAVEEHDIAGLQILASDGGGFDLGYVFRTARQYDAGDVAENIADQAAAIEAAGWGVAAITIRRANEADSA